MPGKVLETYLIKNNIKQHFGVSTGALYVGHCHPPPQADFCPSMDIN